MDDKNIMIENNYDLQRKISVVTPTLNSAEYLEKCIKSIADQNYRNYEHIIVDGGSTDGTLDILRRYEGKYPMKWISGKDGGMYEAINKGFSLSTGNVMAWLNSDDIYHPWTFSVVSKVFSRENINWLTGIPSNIQEIDGTEVTYLMPNLPPIYCTDYIRKGYYDGIRLPFVQQESMFWSRKLWNESGAGLDSTKKMAADYFLWRNFANHEKLYSVHCNLASFRIHANQKSADIDKYHKEMAINCKRVNNKLLLAKSHIYSLRHYNDYMVNLIN